METSPFGLGIIFEGKRKRKKELREALNHLNTIYAIYSHIYISHR